MTTPPVVITLDPAPDWASLNARFSRHERARYVRDVKEIARFAIRPQILGRTDLPLSPVRIDCVWMQPRVSPLRDPDGIGWPAKSTLDACVSLGVIPDDDHRHVASVHYRIEAAADVPHDIMRMTIRPLA